MKEKLQITCSAIPQVLLVGNGLLQLAGGGDWGKLLKQIKKRQVDETSLEDVPYAMRPQILGGVDVEEVQRNTAKAVTESPIHPLLRRLLEMPFDAIITTNYTYEIETALSGQEWTEYRRKRAFCTLHGSDKVRDNTCICNLVKTPTGKQVPVFHIHGEKSRKHSLVLSYYSYAKSVAKLHALNKERGDQYREKQTMLQPVDVWSWLDYFILGDVYSVGFGLDLSEFDLWWALERKAREKAVHGKTYIYMTPQKDERVPQIALADAFEADMKRIDVENRAFLPAYEKVLESIQEKIKKER